MLQYKLLVHLANEKLFKLFSLGVGLFKILGKTYLHGSESSIV